MKIIKWRSVKKIFYSSFYFFINLIVFKEENEEEITQGDRLNEIKARRMQHHHPGSLPQWNPTNVNVTSSIT